MKLRYNLPVLALTGIIGAGCVTTEYDRSFNRFIDASLSAPTERLIESTSRYEPGETHLMLEPRTTKGNSGLESKTIYTTGDAARELYLQNFEGTTDALPPIDITPSDGKRWEVESESGTIDLIVHPE